jgi:Uma2 family endonuclease
MASRTPVMHTSYADYLASEQASTTKHEYVRGDVFAMAGGTIEHGRLQVAVASELRVALMGRPCSVYSGDVRVRVEATDFACYPDISVVCTELRHSEVDQHAITNPKVLVEVLSDSTEGYDRGAKFAHYRRIPSLAEYVLVSQTEPLIEVYRRSDQGEWVLVAEAHAADSVELRSLGVTIRVDAVYADPLAQ